MRVPIPAREDSLIQRQTPARPPRDTVKEPIATAEAPVFADPTGSFVWDRRDVFSTGALTVQDLLDRVPGVTGLRSGWIAQPMISAFLGDPGRVRVFLDGLELLPLDPRMEGMWDLSQIPLWALDDIRIERGPSEIRIYMRSWRVDRTTPFTRTDVYTGDQSTNLYRGLFGRRYQHGEVIQLAGQQYGTDPGRNIASSDHLGALARVGIARKRWSADAFLLRLDRNRGLVTTIDRLDSIPSTESTRSDAYVRFGWGDTESGLWAQGLALASKYTFGGLQESGITTPVSDTTRVESQYMVSAGYALRGWRASFTQRYRAGLQRRIATPAARLGYESKLLTFSAFAEGRGPDSTRRFEVAAVVRPVSFIFLGGSVGQDVPLPLPDSLIVPGQPTAPIFMRGEAGLRLKDVWLSGGILRRQGISLQGPTIMRVQSINVADSSREGLFATVRGRVWKSLYANMQGVQWSDSGSFYRPKYHTRAELYISTSLPKQIPSGNFHLLASAVHEYRSTSLWPDSNATLRVPGYRTISTLVQVRILQAHVFWNFRNLLGERYVQVPGYQLPRLANIYGVRWEFWN